MGGHVKDMHYSPICSSRCCLCNIIELSFAFALVRVAKRTQNRAPDRYQYRFAEVARYRMIRYTYCIVAFQRSRRDERDGIGRNEL